MTLKDIWHRLWGLHAPIEVQVAWHLYFKKSVRDYIRNVQARLNETLTCDPAVMKDFMDSLNDLQVHGAATHE